MHEKPHVEHTHRVMKFQRKHRSCRGLVFGGMAVVTAILPGTASARTAGHLDSSHHVVQEPAVVGARAASQATGSTTQRLVFSRFVPLGVDEIRNEVFSSRPDGSHIRRLTFGHDNVGARWSPRGHRILYLRDGRLWVMGANGGHQHRILGASFGGADWAPSGQRVVVGRGGERGTTLVVRSLQTGAVRQLTGDFTSPGHPRWSPDGKHILFEATPSSRTDMRDLYLIKPDGKGLKNLTSTAHVEEFDADWSPDSRHIVYVRDHQGPCQRLHVMRADGTRDHPIGRGCGDAEPTWSPNGRRILFSPLDDRFGIRHLLVVSLNGRHRHVVTEGQLPDWRP